jgi:hypothetical protein
MKYLLIGLILLMIPQNIITGKHRGGSGPSCSSVTPVSGAIDCWPITEGSGVTINTLSGSGNNITIGAPANFTWATGSGFPGNVGQWGGAAANAIAASSTLENFASTQAFSVSVWEQTGEAGATKAFVTNDNGTTGWFVGTLFNSGQWFTLILQGSTANMIVQGSSNAQTVCTSACNVIYTTDGSGTASGSRIYLNCVAETLTIDADPIGGSMQSGVPVALKQEPAGATISSGLMGTVAIWPFALTPTQACAVTAAGPA